MAVYSDVSRRHDFAFLFDVTDGNPNGDPDGGNLPRVDPETMQGLVTDVALKRKVRDWVDLARGDEGRYKIYVQSGQALITSHKRAYEDLGLSSTGTKQNQSDVEQARAWMCHNFYDIRMFGAVMSVSVNCGQVRGPMQITFARSIDPIVPLDLSITRVAVTREEDRQVSVSEDEGEGRGGKQTEMGRKALVPYGLYRAYGFFNPHLARQTGATEEDLELCWQALQSMWDTDRSAARGLMATRGLYVFTHDSPLGNAPAQKLFERVQVKRKASVAAPRSFGDYEVTVDDATLPSGVTLTALVGEEACRSRLAGAAREMAEPEDANPELELKPEPPSDAEEPAPPVEGWEVPISALEHWSYCPRQCGLIHLEQVFEDNIYTVRGRLAHERVDSGDPTPLRGVPVVRALTLWSERYGLRGKADLVELRPDGPYPVDYKVGRRHGRHPDYQLCAQALCLEEMLGQPVPRGAIYHVATRSRREVEIDDRLRQTTIEMIAQVRAMLQQQRLPAPPDDERCPNCSLGDACLPAVVAEPHRLRGLQGALFQPYDPPPGPGDAGLG